eukprot:TRINITY_DN9703_c0_g1_i1.p1 TRINITY_DN9703_c0_g1~~TRINITY_DN9703_c0_g1_i1.p1  ORF type:complete len:388 (+),score=38.20 TRINITY_DN9703_c0_g1_i1:58-1164(+)
MGTLELFAVAPDGEQYLIELKGNEGTEEIVKKIAESSGLHVTKIELLCSSEDVMLTEMHGQIRFGLKWKPTMEEAVRECETRRLELGRSSLLNYAQKGDQECVKLVYIAEPVPLVSVATTLIARDDMDTLEYLVQLGGDLTTPDVSNETALGYLVLSEGGCDNATRLIELGANVNQLGSLGKTPLMYAAGKGDVNMVRCLVSHRADVKLTCSNGETAMHYAARNGHADVIEALHQSGADINATASISGNTPLHSSARSLGPAIDRLLALGASLSIVNKLNQTALHTAVIEANHEAVTGILSASPEHLKNLNTTLADVYGETAVSYAASQPNMQRTLFYFGVKARPGDLYRGLRKGNFLGFVKTIPHLF